MPSEKGAGTDAFVADASVGIAWSVVSQATPEAEKLRDRIETGTPFLVPVLWPFEVANALLMLLPRKRLAPDEFARACQDLAGLAASIDDEGPHLVWKAATELAERFGLTVYDAAYLELAMRSGLALASRDTSLNAAARLCGVETLL